MKKIRIIISIIIFCISSFIVYHFGKSISFNITFPNIQKVVIKCDKSLINCSHKVKDDVVYINVDSVKSGKTKLKYNIEYIGEDNNLLKEEGNQILYVHKVGIITLKSFFGPCTGDIAYIISIYIIITLIIFYLIKEYIKNKKENLYSYKNARLLGLILFLILTFSHHIFFFLYDLIKMGKYDSINSLLRTINSDSLIFVMVTFPIFFIVTLIVAISNLHLIRKEGKNWRNMLGFLLGGSICFFTIILLFGSVLIFNSIKNPIGTYILDVLVVFMVYLECVLAGVIVLSIKSAKRIPKFDKDAIIILGCQIKKDGSLPPLLKSRVDRAIEFSKMQKDSASKDIYFVPSGGKGSDEIMSESKAMSNYLISQGIKKEYILLEDKSTTTNENIENSLRIIKKRIKKPRIAFSTTNYHVFRAGIIANKIYDNVEGIGAKTKSYYWINAFIREFIATIVSEKKSHIKTLLVLMVIVLFTTILINI